MAPGVLESDEYMKFSLCKKRKDKWRIEGEEEYRRRSIGGGSFADLKFKVCFPTRFPFDNLQYFFSNLFMRCALHINVLTVGTSIVA